MAENQRDRDIQLAGQGASRGAWNGVASVLGAPVDWINKGFSVFGWDTKAPIGGSEHLTRVTNNALDTYYNKIVPFVTGKKLALPQTQEELKLYNTANSIGEAAGVGMTMAGGLAVAKNSATLANLTEKGVARAMNTSTFVTAPADNLGKTALKTVVATSAVTATAAIAADQSESSQPSRQQFDSEIPQRTVNLRASGDQSPRPVETAFASNGTDLQTPTQVASGKIGSSPAATVTQDLGILSKLTDPNLRHASDSSYFANGAAAKALQEELINKGALAPDQNDGFIGKKTAQGINKAVREEIDPDKLTDQQKSQLIEQMKKLADEIKDHPAASGHYDPRVMAFQAYAYGIGLSNNKIDGLMGANTLSDMKKFETKAAMTDLAQSVTAYADKLPKTASAPAADTAGTQTASALLTRQEIPLSP